MTDADVQQLVEQLSLQHFEKPFTHQAYFNPRLRTTGGRYLLASHNIELNKKSYERYGQAELVGIILHELCHYHLHIEGKGYQHRDTDFKRLLVKVGAPRFCSVIEQKASRSKSVYTYRCSSCDFMYKRYRKMDVSKYVCSKCGGSLAIFHHSKR